MAVTNDLASIPRNEKGIEVYDFVLERFETCGPDEWAYLVDTNFAVMSVFRFDVRDLMLAGF